GHERTSHDQIERERTQTRERLAGLTLHLAALSSACEAARQELDDVDQQCRQQKSAVASTDAGLSAAAIRFDEVRAEITRQQDTSSPKARQAGKLHNEAVSHKAHLDTLTRERDRLLHRTEQASADIATIDVELQELTAAEERLQDRLSSARAGVATLRAE